MEVVRSRTEAKFLVDWMRDLSTCTADEIRQRWSAPERAVIEKLDPEGFEKRLETHNPIYFVAEKVFFNNVAGRPEFLYPPFHRDVMCRVALGWLMNEDPFVLRVPEQFEGLVGGTLTVESVKTRSGLIFKAPRDTFKSTFFHGAVPLFSLFGEST